MKTSCSSWSYHRTIANKKMDQLSWIKECAKNGLDGVELLFLPLPIDRKGLPDPAEKSLHRQLSVGGNALGRRTPYHR